MNSFAHSPYDTNDPRIVSAIDDLPLWSAAFGQKILDVVRLGENLNVLDVGCGIGFPLLDLSQRLGETCRCYGIDPWAEAVARARMKIAAWGLTNVEIIEGVAEKLPFEKGYFDIIISNNGINNVDNEKQVLAEIARVAKTGAQLVVTVNLPETFLDFYRVFENVLRDNGKTAEIERLHQHIYAKRKPLDYTKNLIHNAGFEIQSIHTDQFAFRYTNGTAMLNHFFIKLAFLPSWLGIIVDEQETFAIFRQIEIKLNELAEKQGGLKLWVTWVCVTAVRG